MFGRSEHQGVRDAGSLCWLVSFRGVVLVGPPRRFFAVATVPAFTVSAPRCAVVSRPLTPDGYAAAVEALSAYRDNCEAAGWPASFVESSAALVMLAEAREFDQSAPDVHEASRGLR